MKRALFCLFFNLGLLFAGDVCAQINVFTIANGDVVGLKTALTTSNSDGEDDIINLANNGTYTLSAADNLIYGPTGLPVIAADNNHVVTIHGHGSTITRSGSSPFRILQLTNNANVFIDELTISNGLVTPIFGNGFTSGAGIYNNQGTLTVTNCAFDSNAVTGATGSTGVSGDPNGKIGDNGQGGAIDSSGVLNASGCTFTNNTAVGGKGGTGFSGGGNGGNGGDGAGGAIAAGGDAQITNCTFTSNAVANGPGGNGTSGHAAGSPGYAEGGAVEMATNGGTVARCTFSTNSALGAIVDFPGEGGALYCPFLFGTNTIVECSFNGNHADFGGALIGGVIRGCTFENNGANIGGGAVASLGGFLLGNSTTMTNCTFSTNSAPNGGAVYSDGNADKNTLTNCTLVNNTALQHGGSVFYNAAVTNCIFKGGSPENLFTFGANISQGHNVCNDAAEGDAATGPGGDLNATGDLRNTNPLFISDTPSDYGGPTKTIAIGLFGSSPAINHADPSYAPRRDQRGYFRTGAPDTGAFEYQGGVVGRVIAITRTGTNLNDVTVSFEAVDRLTYRLQRKLNITDSTWQDINGVNDLTATGNDIESITAPSDITLGKAFYHVTFVSGP